jgi:predicted dehydrogenase
MTDKEEQMAANGTPGPNRRDFLKVAGGAVLAAGMDARSYDRILGANDRIRLGQLGCGDRSGGHVHMAQLASKQFPVETIAVCDLWSIAREKRAAHVKKVFNLEPRSYKYSEEMLASKDIDGIMIATGDFQHAKLCIDVVQAGKDCYVEKPFANILSEAKEARDAVKASKQVVQMGTEYRSEPYALKVRDIVRSGRLGDLVRIEHQWNANQERWRFPPADVGTSNIAHASWAEQEKWLDSRHSMLREEDTDWKRWLLGKPYRPFDPHVYLEFRLYKDYSTGIFDQWMTHAVDLVHMWTDESYPVSVMATGGIFAWPDKRENPDTCVAAIVYPKGFLYTYQTTLGNSYRSFARIQGRNGTIADTGVEGSSLYRVTKEGGPKESDEGHQPGYTKLPIVAPADDDEELLRIPGAPPPSSHPTADDSVAHMMNWLTAMRDRREPNATVDNGFSHSIVCIMAAQSQWTGKRVYWDPKREEIVDQPLETSLA